VLVNTTGMLRLFTHIYMILLVCITLQAQQNTYGLNDLDNAYIQEMMTENSQLTERIKSQPAAFQELNKEAGQAIRSKDYAAALAVANKLEEKYPKNPDVKNFKGKMQSKLGDNTAAIKSFGQALALNTDNKWFYINKATGEAESNLMSDALKTIESLIKKYPQWSIGYNFKAALLHSLKNDSEALKAYDMAVKNEPKSAQVFANRGDLYLEMGNKVKAFEDYNAALAIQPDYKRAHDQVSKLQGTAVFDKK